MDPAGLYVLDQYGYIPYYWNLRQPTIFGRRRDRTAWVLTFSPDLAWVTYRMLFCAVRLHIGGVSGPLESLLILLLQTIR